MLQRLVRHATRLFGRYAWFQRWHHPSVMIRVMRPARSHWSGLQIHCWRRGAVRRSPVWRLAAAHRGARRVAGDGHTRQRPDAGLCRAADAIAVWCRSTFRSTPWIPTTTRARAAWTWASPGRFRAEPRAADTSPAATPGRRWPCSATATSWPAACLEPKLATCKAAASNKSGTANRCASSEAASTATTHRTRAPSVPWRAYPTTSPRTCPASPSPIGKPSSDAASRRRFRKVNGKTARAEACASLGYVEAVRFGHPVKSQLCRTPPHSRSRSWSPTPRSAAICSAA